MVKYSKNILIIPASEFGFESILATKPIQFFFKELKYEVINPHYEYDFEISEGKGPLTSEFIEELVEKYNPCCIVAERKTRELAYDVVKFNKKYSERIFVVTNNTLGLNYNDEEYEEKGIQPIDNSNLINKPNSYGELAERILKSIRIPDNYPPYKLRRQPIN
ncbi:MAG: hypothetical protein GXO64_01285 [Candidatus Micrarchaeota archaeon]|nr:hypothetical protein [Candidatus Micrarchaeota archaeon]